MSDHFYFFFSRSYFSQNVGLMHHCSIQPISNDASVFSVCVEMVLVTGHTQLVLGLSSYILHTAFTGLCIVMRQAYPSQFLSEPPENSHELDLLSHSKSSPFTKFLSLTYMIVCSSAIMLMSGLIGHCFPSHNVFQVASLCAL